MGQFVFHREISISYPETVGAAVKKAVSRFQRDCAMTLAEPTEAVQRQTGASRMVLQEKEMEPEAFVITFPSEEELKIQAGDELGFIYALLELSERALGITPFWFWNDQQFVLRATAVIPCEAIRSRPMAVRFRGWFINDEVLFMKWKIDGDSERCWEMAMEALLRCRGNLVIPGTDKDSRLYRGLAAQMGLWITHHHAEPLGAEMFSRAYPELSPSYAQYPEKYQALWREALEVQKDNSVIWTLGFRGQGDIPFWNQDPRYQTDEARGRLISEVIQLQYELVRERYPEAVCCTNLYGEIMDLYRKGCISLPKDVIQIWADNGYGKMVSRRQGNVNPRVPALPGESDRKGHHGTYYHVSFYDLQAANHITMLPNSMEFVQRELTEAYEKGIRDLWIINCSNVKPHVLYLDEIRRLWSGERIPAEQMAEEYVETYYHLKTQPETAEWVASCYRDFAKHSIVYGSQEDERAGEQFTNYLTRILTWAWRRNTTDCVRPLLWATGEKRMPEQVSWYRSRCEEAREPYQSFVRECEACLEQLEGADRQLFSDSVLLQARVYLTCLEGACLFCEGYEAFAAGEYLRSFYLIGQAADAYQAGEDALRASEHGKWEGFYYNECLTDIKFTAYELRQLMGHIRNIGDGPSCFQWLRQVMYSAEDRKVALISHMDNHPTDEALYQAMKEAGGCEGVSDLRGISDSE